MKTRIGAIVLQQGKILLVKDRKYDEFQTPGGKLEDGENDEACLRRELQEELGVAVMHASFFKSYKTTCIYHGYEILNKLYFVTISGDPMARQEIERCDWFDQAKLEKTAVLPVNRLLIPDLAEHGLL